MEEEKCDFCGTTEEDALNWTCDCDECGRTACISCFEQKFYEAGKLGLRKYCEECFKKEYPKVHEAYKIIEDHEGGRG